MRPRRRSLLAREPLGLAVVLGSAVLLYWAFLHNLPFAGGPEGRLVRAEVRTAAGVTSRTPVRVGGTDVGTVERLERAAGGRTTTLVMRVTNDGVRMHSDAAADIRYRTLLGGSMYVDLDPGSPSAPPLGKRTIPLARTTAQVDWDEFNGMWAKPIPQAQRQMIKGLGDALDDPAAWRALIRRFGGDLRSFGAAATAGRGEQDGDLPSLIRHAGSLSRALSRDGASLSTLIRGAQRTAAATARVRASLGATVAAAPPALHSARVAMRRLDGTLTRVDPLLPELIGPARATAPTVRKLRPALVNTDRLLHDAEPLLTSAPPALDTLRATVGAGMPFLAALRALSDRLVDQFIPFTQEVNPASGLKLLQEIGPWLSGQNDSYSGFDDNGYFLRGAGNQSPDSVALPCSAGSADCKLLRQAYRLATRTGP